VTLSHINQVHVLTDILGPIADHKSTASTMLLPWRYGQQS